MSKTKKIIILTLIGIVCVAGLYFAWRVVFGTPIDTSSGGGEVTRLPGGDTNTTSVEGGGDLGGSDKNTENAPSTDVEVGDIVPKLEKLSNQEIVFFWVNKKTKDVFYTTPGGEIYLAKEMGDQKISPQAVGIMYTLLPNQTGEKVLASFGEKDAPQLGIFDVIDKTWKPLSSDVLTALWGGSDKKLFGIIKNGGKKDLVEINTEKTPPVYKTLLKDFVLNNVSLSIVPIDKILISEKSSSFYSPRMWEFNPKDLSLSLIAQGERGGMFGFSKDNKNLLFSIPSKKQLGIINNSLKTTTYVDFFTIPDKCDLFASTTYCFVPEEQKDYVGFFDLYQQRKIFTTDTLMKFNLSTKEIGVLSASAAIAYKTDAVGVVFFENYIYFKNRFDDILYRLDISKEL